MIYQQNRPRTLLFSVLYGTIILPGTLWLLGQSHSTPTCLYISLVGIDTELRLEQVGRKPDFSLSR